MRKIITISREFGSGGRELRKRLADELGFKYYDKEILEKILENDNYDDTYIKNFSEKQLVTNTLHYANSFYIYESIQNPRTEIIAEEHKLLRKLANKENCVIVGRAANSILKEFDPFNIFVYSDMKYKLERCRTKGTEEEAELTNENIEKQINKIDKGRKKYYESVSDLKWGNKLDFDLCINTSKMEIKKMVPSLASYIKEFYKQ